MKPSAARLDVPDLEALTAHALARFEVLLARRHDGPPVRDELVANTLQELSVALEELRVSVETMREQSEALAAVRQELVAEQARFQALFDFAPDGYLVTDSAGIIRRANQRAADLLGVKPERLVGKPLTVFIALPARPAFRALLSQLAAGDRGTLDFEARLTARLGRTFEAAISVAGTKELRWLLRDVTTQRAAQHALEDEVSERKRTEDRLRNSEDRYRQLSGHLQGAIEEERTRIAREVHDELGAALTAIRFELSAIAAAMPGGERAPGDALAASIGRVDAAIGVTRRICGDLRPSLLDHVGLWAAIEWLVEDLGGRTGIRCTVDLEKGGEVPDSECATALFRIVQEAVTNTVRHAGASKLHVAARASGGELVIEVSDDGRGIREGELARPDAFGIIGMQERAHACRGRVLIEGGRVHGTRVQVRVPLPTPRRRDARSNR